MTWITGDVSGSQTLTDSDHLYATHVDQLRESSVAQAIVATTPNAQYYCNGTNDHLVIQTAINDVSAAGGGEVFIKRGTYNVGNVTNGTGLLGLPYYSIKVPSGVTVRGEGIGKTIINLTAFVSGTGQRNTVFINSAHGDTDIYIRDMTILNPAYLGGAGAYWGGCICMEGASRVLIQNIRSVNASWWFRGGVYSYNSTTKEMTTDANYYLLDNVTVDQHLGSCSAEKIRYFTLRNSVILGSEDDPFITTAMQDGWFLFNFIDAQAKTSSLGASTACIYLANDGSLSLDNDAIRDIKIIGNTLRRLNLPSGGVSGITLSRCKNIDIIDNSIEKNTGYGIENGGGTFSENVTIIGNRIRQNLKTGIKFGHVATATTKHLTIVNNQIYDNTGNGILIAVTSNNTLLDSCLIRGNDCWDDQGIVTQTIGIEVDTSPASSTISNTVIEGNSVRDSTTKYSFSTGGSMTMMVRNNNGYVTENSGTATVANGTTSIVVNHGLSRTPADGDIVVTPTNNMGTATKFFVNNYTATQFTINVDQNPGASTATFLWKALIIRTSF